MKTLSLKRNNQPLSLNLESFEPGRAYVVFNRFNDNYLLLSLKGKPLMPHAELLVSKELEVATQGWGKPVSVSNDDAFLTEHPCTEEAEEKWDLLVSPHRVGNRTYWVIKS